jgi:site-specific recombinase XerD
MIDTSKRKVDRAECLVRYRGHLDKARGLATATQRSYLLIARRFLESLGSTRRIKHSKFTAAAVTEFVRSDAGSRRGQGPNITVSATRSFIRFLISEGVVQTGLDGAVPKVRRYKHAALPAYFSDLEIEQILAFSKDGSEKGIRNYALLLLISRFGLRIDEAAKLTLDDIDWNNGFVVIRAGKNRRERKLPLPEDVGQAILHYLRRVRPKVDDRHIFLHWAEPFTGYEGSSLGKIVNRLLAGAGVRRPSVGSHLFRHAAATKMVNHGASFKEIADLMGHQSLSSTAIYAKLNFESLAQVALAWPGGDS